MPQYDLEIRAEFLEKTVAGLSVLPAAGAEPCNADSAVPRGGERGYFWRQGRQIGELRGGHDELRREMHGIRDELRSEMRGMHDQLVLRIDGCREELVGQIDGCRDELRADMASMHSATSQEPSWQARRRP